MCTPDANEAAREINDRQLLVHGLPSEFPTGTPGGPQENALNTLIKSLGIILEQGHVVGAHPVEPTTSNDKSPVIRLTMNSKETKEIVRKAAEATNRWGTAGNHKVFLRETTTKRRRTPSTEDSRTPKKPRQDETPKLRPNREGSNVRRRRADGNSGTKPEENPRTGKAKLVGKNVPLLDEEVARRDGLKKLKAEQLEARLAKLKHQEEEDKETQSTIDRRGQRAREVDSEKKGAGQSSKIRTFVALNESAGEEDNKSRALVKTLVKALQTAGPQGYSESEDDAENPGEARKEANTGDGAESEEPIGLEFGSEIDRDDDEDYDYEYSEDDDEQEEPSEDYPSSEREVFYKNTSTKNAGRNRRRRKKKQLVPDQRLRPATERVPQNKRPGHKGAQI